MQDNKGILKFLGGLAAGATLGVLFAPRSGKETRELIAEKASEQKDKLDDLIVHGRKEWSELRGKAANAATMTREEADDLIKFILSEGKDLWNRMNEDAVDSANNVAKEVSKQAKKVRHATASDN
jgi:gas vesicle protein